MIVLKFGVIVFEVKLNFSWIGEEEYGFGREIGFSDASPNLRILPSSKGN